MPLRIVVIGTTITTCKITSEISQGLCGPVGAQALPAGSKWKARGHQRTASRSSIAAQPDCPCPKKKGDALHSRLPTTIME